MIGYCLALDRVYVYKFTVEGVTSKYSSSKSSIVTFLEASDFRYYHYVIIINNYCTSLVISRVL